jgi:curli biogenesis system outer membrane secretion channel CsgG
MNMKNLFFPMGLFLIVGNMVFAGGGTQGLSSSSQSSTTPSAPVKETFVERAVEQQVGVEGALAKAARETFKNVQQKAKIAIVYITAPDRSTTDFIAGELEYIWVNAGYIIIDRSQLDSLRREQDFQLSGEVDDETAVSIGKIAGADIIVTGRIDGEGSLRRLRLRAINTQTAQVIGVASERY